MQERSTPLLRLLGDIKNTLDHLAETVSEYEQSYAQKKKQESDVELKAIVRLPEEVTSYYVSEQRERSVKNRHEAIRMRLEFAGVLVP